jgi:SanA protein
MKIQLITKYKKLIYIFIITGIAFISGLIIISNVVINYNTKDSVYNSISEIKECNVGLLLGTIKNLKDGRENLYFNYRINAAVELYNAGKIKYIIVSGDNHIESYNEPGDMRDALIAEGIPDNVIYLDYAGFRTFDSVIRCKEIFGQNEFIIISQKFHNQRAVYIAQQKGITAYGYNAKDVSAYSGFKTKIRELFARTKVFIDLLLGVEPKFYGEEISVGN